MEVTRCDFELRDIVLEELTAADIAAEITHTRLLDGSLPENVANKTRIGGCAQLEMGTSTSSTALLLP